MDEETKQRIIKIVTEKEKPLKDLSNKLFISEYQLKILLNSWGVEIPKRRSYNKVKRPERTILLEAYSRLGNLEKTANELGVSINTVSKWLKELKIPTKKLVNMSNNDKAELLESHIGMLGDLDL